MAIYHLDHKVTGNFLQTHKPIVLDDTLHGVPKTILQIALCYKPNINVTPAMIKEQTAETDYPHADYPHAANQHDNNIDITNNITEDNTNNTYLSHYNINQSIHPNIIDTGIDGVVRAIRKQIDYDILCSTCPRRLLDDLVATMVDVMVQQGNTIHVTRDKSYPTAYIQRLFAKLNALHIEMVCRNIEHHAYHVTNTTSYLITCLINAAINMDTSYDYSDCDNL